MAHIYVEDEEQNIENKLPTVRLVGVDSNAFAIMGNVKKAMQAYARVDSEYNAKYMFRMYQEEATAGDYDNLLQVTMNYCDIY